MVPSASRRSVGARVLVVLLLALGGVTAGGPSASAADAQYWVIDDHGIQTLYGSSGVWQFPQTPTAATVVAADGRADRLVKVTSTGQVVPFGMAAHGDATAIPLAAPITDVALAGDLDGYWLLGEDGGVFSFGAAPFAGSATTTPVASRFVAMASRPDGAGYHLVTADGTVLAFDGSGGAPTRLAGTEGLVLAAPIVDIELTPAGDGYWLFAADGGVFTFGAAPFLGSAAPLDLQRPIVDGQRTSDGSGYWLLGADGGVFTYGTAAYRGSPTADGLGGTWSALVGA